jgi:hypothetical protein
LVIGSPLRGSLAQRDAQHKRRRKRFRTFDLTLLAVAADLRAREHVKAIRTDRRRRRLVECALVMRLQRLDRGNGRAV